MLTCCAHKIRLLYYFADAFIYLSIPIVIISFIVNQIFRSFVFCLFCFGNYLKQAWLISLCMHILNMRLRSVSIFKILRGNMKLSVCCYSTSEIVANCCQFKPSTNKNASRVLSILTIFFTFQFLKRINTYIF